MDYEEARELVWQRNWKKFHKITIFLMEYNPNISIADNARNLGWGVKAATALVKNYRLRVFKAKNQWSRTPKEVMGR